MDDVELLVLTFYEFADHQRMEALNAGSSHHDGTTGEQHSDEHASNAGQQQQPIKGKKGGPVIPVPVVEERKATEEYVPLGDDDLLTIDNDNIVSILKDFHRKREERANNAELLGNPRMKKRSNFETEEQKKERIKREERIFWEKMTTVLDEKKLSTWKALDKALSKYYSLLVERQNLIEETGLLNQQNEELKTLLNQYLQAGVNHELHVPPTQVIRLDI